MSYMSFSPQKVFSTFVLEVAPEVQIPFTYMYDGALDSFSMQSDTTWFDFQFAVAEKLMVPVAALKLGYKFTTDAKGQAPNNLGNTRNFVNMIIAAKEGLEESRKANGKGKKSKPFKVEIIDRGALEAKDKAKKASVKGGKGKKKVISFQHYGGPV